MFNTKQWIKRFDRWMMAVTFAEAGEREMTLDALHQKSKKKRLVSGEKKRIEHRPVLRV